jgi:hypothetical protein
LFQHANAGKDLIELTTDVFHVQVILLEEILAIKVKFAVLPQMPKDNHVVQEVKLFQTIEPASLVHHAQSANY